MSACLKSQTVTVSIDTPHSPQDESTKFDGCWPHGLFYLEQTAKRAGLKINTAKSKIKRINPKHQPMKLNNMELEHVNTFLYLGATISKQGGGLEDMRRSYSFTGMSYFHFISKKIKIKAL